MNMEAFAADEAAREYDERLNFGFNPVHKDWVVFIRLPRDYEFAPYHIDGEPVAIVLGFGKDAIPSREQVQKKLWETDALRHGEKLLDNLNKHNEELQKERNERLDEITQEAAERMEHALRYEGKSPVVKVFFQPDVKRRSGYHVGKRNDSAD